MRQRKFSTTNEPGGANRGNTTMVTPISRHGFRTGKCSDIRFSCRHHSTITWMRLCAPFPTVYLSLILSSKKSKLRPMDMSHSLKDLNRIEILALHMEGDQEAPKNSKGMLPA